MLLSMAGSLSSLLQRGKALRDLVELAEQGGFRIGGGLGHRGSKGRIQNAERRMEENAMIQFCILRSAFGV